jgi:hypothetical protein
MKKNNDSGYSEISSFEDFLIEKERLIFRSRLNEANLNLSYLKVSNMFSITGQLISITKDFVLPRISGLINDLLKKTDLETDK